MFPHMPPWKHWGFGADRLLLGRRGRRRVGAGRLVHGGRRLLAMRTDQLVLGSSSERTSESWAVQASECRGDQLVLARRERRANAADWPLFGRRKPCVAGSDRLLFVAPWVLVGQAPVLRGR